MSRFGFSNAAAKPEPVNAPEVAEPTAPKPAPPAPADTKAFDQLDAKLRIHAKLIDELDLSVLDKLDDETMRRRVRGIVSEIIKKEEMALSATEEASFADAVMDEMTGLGPIEPLLKDDSIADILINGFDQVYVERHGKLQLAPVRFADNDHLLRIVQRIVAADVSMRASPWLMHAFWMAAVSMPLSCQLPLMGRLSPSGNSPNRH